MDTLCRLMLSELPETINPMRLAKAGKTLSGGYKLHQLQRVNVLLEGKTGEQVSFRLEFSQDNENRLFSIVGGLETKLPMVCQRCMAPMQYQLSGMINIAIVSSEAEAEVLPEPFEPYIDTGDSVKLQDFIEDELLLAMPLVSLHEKKDCPAADKFKRVRLEKVSPFAGLKNLKLDN